MDLPLELALEIAEQKGADVLTQKCPDCNAWYLMLEFDRSMPSCWGCVTDRMTAMSGRTLLLRIKLGIPSESSLVAR